MNLKGEKTFTLPWSEVHVCLLMKRTMEKKVIFISLTKLFCLIWNCFVLWSVAYKQKFMENFLQKSSHNRISEWWTNDSPPKIFVALFRLFYAFQLQEIHWWIQIVSKWIRESQPLKNTSCDGKVQRNSLKGITLWKFPQKTIFRRRKLCASP